MPSKPLRKCTVQEKMPMPVKKEKPGNPTQTTGNVIPTSNLDSKENSIKNTSSLQEVGNANVVSKIGSTCNENVHLNVKLKLADSVPAEKTIKQNSIEQKVSIEENKKHKDLSKGKENTLGKANSIDENVSKKAATGHENSDTSNRGSKTVVTDVNKNISPKKKWIGLASKMGDTKEDSMKQTKSSSSNISLRKHLAKNSPTKLDSFHEDNPEDTLHRKTVITVIKVQQNSATETDSVDHTKSPSKILNNKDTPLLKESTEHSPEKLQKTRKKKSPKKDIVCENTTETSTLSNIRLDIVKTETDIDKNTSVDESTENNCNQEAVMNVNITTLLLSPKNTSEVLDQLKIEICKTETFPSSPQAASSKTASEPHTPLKTSDNCIKQQTTMFQTPIKLESKNPTYKRKGRTGSDSECLSDTLKSELCDSDRINDFEAIDMLHDLDTVIDFEDSKMTSYVLLPSFPYDCNTQDESKNADIDPLFIDPSEQKGNSPINKSIPLKKRKRTFDYSPPPNCRRIRRSQRLKMHTNIGEDMNMEENVNAKEEEVEARINNLEKLRDMRVQLLHVPPPQHTIEECVLYTRPLLPEQVLMFEKYGPLKKTPFSTEEDDIIFNNWKMFCKIHKWDPANVKPFIRTRQGGSYTMRLIANRRKFAQFLANGLPWRCLYSVRARFKALHSFDRTRRHIPYTADEDRMILSYVQTQLDENNKHPSFCELSETLGRKNGSVRARYQLLKKHHRLDTEETPLQECEWTLPLVEKYLTTLMNLTMSESLEELKYAIIPKEVWNKLEQKLKIDTTVLKNFWYRQLHIQLFYKKPIYLNDVKIQLIEYIYGKGISCKGDLVWSQVIEYFHGMTKHFLQRVFFNLTRQYEKSKSFIEIIETLYHEKIPEIRNDITDKHLPRLSYNNGKLEVIVDITSDNEH